MMPCYHSSGGGGGMRKKWMVCTVKADVQTLNEPYVEYFSTVLILDQYFDFELHWKKIEENQKAPEEIERRKMLDEIRRLVLDIPPSFGS
jgi:acyl-CoA synthetase (AMP-forming)/AMP-acid ligase II